MTRRLALGHSAGAGLVLGLLVAERPFWIFGAGIVTGVALVFAVRALRRVLKIGGRVARLVGRAGGGSAWKEVSGAGQELPPAELSELERARAYREGLRQGEAAGIRAAARAETHDRAQRATMEIALEDHWRDVRARSLEHALDVTDPRD